MPAVSGTVMLTDCLMSEQTVLAQELGAAQIHVWLGTLSPERASGLCASANEGPLRWWRGRQTGGFLQLSIKEGQRKLLGGGIELPGILLLFGHLL